MGDAALVMAPALVRECNAGIYSFANVIHAECRMRRTRAVPQQWVMRHASSSYIIILYIYNIIYTPHSAHQGGAPAVGDAAGVEQRAGPGPVHHHPVGAAPGAGPCAADGGAVFGPRRSRVVLQPF